MNQIEEYLETNQVYELFEDLLKQLVVKRPEKPLDFIMQALRTPNVSSTIVYLSLYSSSNFLTRRSRVQQERKRPCSG